MLRIFLTFLMCLLWRGPLGYSQGSLTVLDMRDHSWETQAELTGPWDFFPGLISLPAAEQRAPCHLVPGYWQGQICGGKKLLAKSHGVYRLVLRGLPQDIPLQFSLIRAFMAYELYVDRKLIAKHGGEGDELFAQSFSTSRGEVEVLLLIQNRDFMYGGLYNRVYLGLADKVKKQEKMAQYLEVFLASCLGILGLYHLAFFGLRPKNPAPLLFACFCFLVSWRTLFVGQGLYFELMGNPRSEYKILWVMYVSYYLAVPTFAYFTHYLFPEEFPSRSARFSLLVTLGLLGTVAFLPFSVWQLTAEPFHIFVVFFMGYTVRAVVYAVRKRRDGALLFLTGTLILCLSTLSDIITLALNGKSQDNAVVFGLFSFLLLQSFILAKRFSHAFDQAENLSLALKEQERVRTQFFHNISHELRTPLNGIMGYLDLVRKGQFGNVTQASFLQLGKALHLAESLTTQVNTILDLAKAKGGELKLVVQAFSLSEILEEADQLGEGLKLRDQKLTYTSEGTFSSKVFQGDKDKIFTIIRNLLGNAFKFRDPQRLHAVRLSLKRTEDKLLITVADTGIGIPPEFHKKIFEEFAQVEGDARRSYEGTGLGLNLVEKLVKLMGGSITLHSELGVGTEFFIEIPEAKGEIPSLMDRPRELVSPSARGEDQTLDLRPLSLQEPIPHSDIRILVIDDNEINCDVIKGTLQLDGYQVETVLSGRMGLLAMRRNPPDLVLLDMMMPELSGEDVLWEMKQDSHLTEIPVILVTARASEEDRIEGLRLGADDYLPKPIFAAELRLRVRNMVERNRLLREVGRATQVDKVTQLGELFGDLSHELKNILQSGGFQRIHEEDAILMATVMGLEEESRVDFVEALLKPSLNSGIVKRIDALQALLKGGSSPDLYLIIHHLAELDLALERLSPILSSIELLGPFEQRYFSSQFRLLSEFKSLLLAMDRCRRLTQSVLAYSRMDDVRAESQLDMCWDQAFGLIQPQLRASPIRWELDLAPLRMGISPAHLTQILINLAINARDAVMKLSASEQWVRLSVRVTEKFAVLEIHNGGPPIAPEVCTKLFLRGFTTKGEKGSGIGLHVSRRLAIAVGGDLRYSEQFDHPCFQLQLPCLEGQQEKAS